MMGTILARSQRYVITAEYEEVYLVGAKQWRTLIGDFYGDPVCALIDQAEQWCLVGGTGLILYYFHAPFQPYTYNTVTAQWHEWFREPPTNLNVEMVYQVDPDTVRFVVDPYADTAGIYELSISQQRIIRLFPPRHDEDGNQI
jgi:hypothetical protein